MRGSIHLDIFTSIFVNLTVVILTDYTYIHSTCIRVNGF